MNPPTTTVGFIGLGMMGHGMAKNLLAKGFGLRFVAHRNRSNLDDLIAAGAVEASGLAELLRGDTFVYICGLKGMETGVLDALNEACSASGLDWSATHQRLVDEGRFHVETY